MSFKKEVRDIIRLKEIITILFEEGFGYYISKIKLGHKLKLKHRFKAKKIPEEKSLPERLRVTFEKLGPTFIKLGQILSLRPDLVPKEYIWELSKLQDRVPAIEFDKIKDSIDLKNFSYFDKKPIASASISQVYMAKLKSGEFVAVKVLKPKTKEIMQTDIDIMYYFARLLERHFPKLRHYDIIGMIDEFAKWTEKELDFKNEIRNAKKFRNNFLNHPKVYIPKVYEEYSNSSMLVMEYIDGIELHDIKRLKKSRANFKEIIKNGLESILTQVFVHGFFHADPHPGNILVLKNNKVALVDFGIVGYFDEGLKKDAFDIFYGIMQKDINKLAETLVELGDVRLKKPELESFKDDLRESVEALQESSLKDVKVSSVLEDVFDICLKYGIKIPKSFALFGKTVVTIEGIGLEYDPSIKFAEIAKPFFEKIYLGEKSPAKILKDSIKSIKEYKDFAARLPREADEVMKKIKEGKIKIDVEDTDISKLSLEIDRSSNRVAYGMIIAALILSGSWIINAGDGRIFRISYISFFFFFLALIIFLVLVFSIIREKRLKEVR